MHPRAREHVGPASWPAEIERLVEQVCQEILDALEATSCALSHWDREGGTVTTRVIYALHPELDSPLHTEVDTVYSLEEYAATARVLQERATVAIRVDDPQADPAERALLEKTGQQALLMLPLIAEEEVVGLLEIFQRDHPRSFSSQEIALAQVLGRHAATVIENAYLAQEREQRLTELSILNEIGQALATPLTLAELLETVHQQISRVFETTNFYIALYYEATDEWELVLDIEEGERLAPRRFKVGAGLTGYIIRSRSPLLFRSQEETRDFHVQQGIDTIGEVACSWMGVPLISADKLVGVMTIQSYQQENLYDDQTQALFSTVAAQVANALDNLRLLVETRRRAQEMELINEVGRAITSVLDLDELLRQIVDVTKARFGHYFVSIALVEGDHLVPRGGSTIGDSDTRIAMGEERIDLHGGPSLLAEVARTGRPVLVDDVLEDPRYLPVAELVDTRAELDVPIKFKDRVVGVLDVQSDHPHAYGEDDVAFLEALASQAGVAIQNALFFSDRERHITALSILNETGQVLSSALELGELPAKIYQQVNRFFDASNFYIALYEEDRDEWVMAFHLEHGQPQPIERHKADVGVTGYIIHNRNPILLRTLEENVAFDRERGVPLLGDQARSWMGVPLISADKMVGVMTIQSYDQEYLYDEQTLALFSTIAAQAAIAIENARLYTRVQQQLEELRRASEIQSRLWDQVQEMSTPVIPIHNRIVVLPLIGVIDSERARQFTERLLNAVREYRATVVLVDITGVPVVDTAVAQSLIHAAEATRLLGAQVLLVGVRSEVAQTLVTLGLELGDVVTKANLQAGIEYALSQVGLYIVPKPEEPSPVRRSTR